MSLQLLISAINKGIETVKGADFQAPCSMRSEALAEAQPLVILQGLPNFQHPLDHRKSKRIPEKHLLLL